MDVIRTEDETAHACLACAVVATARNGRGITRSRHLPCGSREAAVLRHESRRRWAAPRWPRPASTEQALQVPARMRITGSPRPEAGTVEADGGPSVLRAGRDPSLSWLIVPHPLARERAADAWHIGSLDAIGGRGPSGQVEGRSTRGITAPSASSCAATRKTWHWTNSTSSRPSWREREPTAGRSTGRGGPGLRRVRRASGL